MYLHSRSSRHFHFLGFSYTPMCPIIADGLQSRRCRELRHQAKQSATTSLIGTGIIRLGLPWYSNTLALTGCRFEPFVIAQDRFREESHRYPEILPRSVPQNDIPFAHVPELGMMAPCPPPGSAADSRTKLGPSPLAIAVWDSGARPRRRFSTWSHETRGNQWTADALFAPPPCISPQFFSTVMGAPRRSWTASRRLDARVSSS